MTCYYNEVDRYAAQWLRNLIAAGHIAAGDVDDCSILDVQADDLKVYDQCHFFAGIGGWSYALRLAGIPDDRPVWTGSCPCQPFSTAGSQRGCNDERHLWPAFYNLIRECRPATVVGEQVAGAAGLAWIDHVHADLEDAGYAVAAANLCAAGVGAPHVRQRLYWVAHADSAKRRPGRESAKPAEWTQSEPAGPSAFIGLAHSDGGHAWRGEQRFQPGSRGLGVMADSKGRRLGQGCADTPWGNEGAGEEGSGERPADDGGSFLVDARSEGFKGREQHRSCDDEWDRAHAHGPTRQPDRALDPWASVDWIECRDGKSRPTQPGIFPLASRVPAGMVRGSDRGSPIHADATQEARVMRLRGYGNAIVPQVAAAFLMAALAP